MILTQYLGVDPAATLYGLCNKLIILVPLSSLCYNNRAEAEEGVLVPIVVFLVFVVLVVLVTLALGYGLSSAEARDISRRCQMPYEMHGRRKSRRQRVQCRFSKLK